MCVFVCVLPVVLCVSLEKQEYTKVKRAVQIHKRVLHFYTRAQNSHTHAYAHTRAHILNSMQDWQCIC